MEHSTTSVRSPLVGDTRSNRKRKSRKRHRVRRTWSKLCKRFKKGLKGAVFKETQRAGRTIGVLIVRTGVHLVRASYFAVCWLSLTLLGFPPEILLDLVSDNLNL